jgi:manganese/zinc/iron transport system permease protein
MPPSLHTFLSTDLPALLAATFAAVSCALLGNFLVLRRQSLMGDAISHAVLPGLVAAFLIAGTRSAWPMFVGAALAGVVTVVLVELVRRLGRVEPGAAMGVVFSIMFALGVVLLERAAARHVDLDADCVLYGQLELIFWFPPNTWSDLLTLDTLSQFPRQPTTLAVVTFLTIALVTLLFKELRLAAFDPDLATSLGFSATVLHFILMLFVAGAVVASFEAVGSILVVAMLICPAATARLLTDRLLPQVLVSVLAALISALGGYALAATAPTWLGTPKALSAAGMITTVSGVLLTAAIFFSPTHGVLAKRLRHVRLAITIAREDLLATLYRLEEANQPPPAAAQSSVLSPQSFALRLALRNHEIEQTPSGALRLTETGRDAARRLIRTHRLWETYLVEAANLRPDHVHDTAETLEHLTTPPIHAELTRHPPPPTDPQGKPIP